MSSPPGVGSQGTAAFRKVQQEARVRSSHIGVPTYKSGNPPRSGVQPDARGMVLCPYCSKTFPFSVALLNRQLRCNGCRGVFRVAEDRRSFRIQAPEAPAAPHAGDLSKATRSAIKQANASLNEAAAEALRAVSRQEPGARPGSGSAIRARTAVAPPQAKASLPRRSPTAILTGQGEERHRDHRRLLTAGILLATLLVGGAAWVFRGDPLRDALWDFQGAASRAQTWAGSVSALRQSAASAEIDSIVNIDRASFAAVATIDTAALATSMSTLRAVHRGGVCVEQGRLSEAKALIGKHDLSSEAGQRAFHAACTKAGIKARTWAEIVAGASAGQPDGVKDVLDLLMSRPQPRQGGFDPVVLIGNGQVPSEIQILPFSGVDGSLLQQTGPPLHPTAYRGRLIRFSGTGWPTHWMVLDLRRVQ